MTAIARLAGALTLSVVVACSGAGGASASRPTIISTLTQVSALVRAVGGDRIDLVPLLRPADDPHAYEIKPEQVTRLVRAAAIFESGVDIDKWLDRGVEAAGVGGRAVDLSRSVRLREATGEEHGPDPHWWYDTDNAMAATDAIARALERADPGGRDTYERNAAAERERLRAADAEVQRTIDVVPRERRLFVANHDAFGYFLARYEITLVGDILPSTDSMAAVRPADVARLVSDIHRQHVCAIFTETTIDPRLAGQIAAESGAKVYDGRLYGDAIGEPGTSGGTLEGALVRNGRLMASAFTSC